MKRFLEVLVVVIGALIIACGFNIFLIPHILLAGGVSGFSMIISYFTPLSMGTLYFALNLPLIIAGWFFIGRKFIIYSLLSVATTTIALNFIPVKMVAADPLLSAIYAGVLIGIGTGFSFKVGGSSGGFDILGAIISKYRSFSIGTSVTYLNALVIVAAGYINDNWNITLASAICVYICGRVINFIHIEHEKVTLYIITDHIDPMVAELFKLHQRGITRINSSGAYSGESRDMLMTVVTRYELLDVKEAVRRVDPNAFVNITQTLEVMGYFRKKAA
ncbi:MAG: YitT family protein [Candidatus Pristimantibacillus sp.]